MGFTANIEHISLPHTNEEISGDTVIVHRSPHRIRVLLSDGLGTGITASMSSILTTEILLHLLDADVPMEESLRLIFQTLPLHPVVHQAYATLTVIDIDRTSSTATITTMGNPSVLLFRNSLPLNISETTHSYEGKQWTQQSLTLQSHDILVAMTDGFPGSTSDSYLDNGLTLTSLRRSLSQFLLTHSANATDIKEHLLQWALQPYGGKLQDDASCVIIQNTPAREVTVLFGPPSIPSQDEKVLQQFLSASGKKIICGGTTSKLVSSFTGIPIRTLPHTASDGVPPYATMETVDLVTEGVLTFTRAIQYLSTSHLPEVPNGASLLAQELLSANFITFLVGAPELPTETKPPTISAGFLRKSLVRQCAALLENLGREVYTLFL